MNLRLILYNTELCDTVINMNHGITHCNCRQSPHIIVSTVGTVYNSAAVCLNNSEILISRTSWHNVCFISLWQLHCHTKRNQFKFSCFHFDFFGCTKINPVGFAIDICKLFDFICKIFDTNLFHSAKNSFSPTAIPGRHALPFYL